MPSSNPPPPSQSPASGPPPSQPPASVPAPASADTITQALETVKAAFPADSSILSDLQLTASDDTTASITIVVNDQASGFGTDGIGPIMLAIWDQFRAATIPQGTDISYCLASDPSTVTSLEDLSHSWAIVDGSMAPDSS